MKDFFVNAWIIVIIAVVVAGLGLGLGLGLFFGLRGGPQVTVELQSYSVDADGLGGAAGWATGDQWVYSMHIPIAEVGPYDGIVTYTVTGDGMIDGTDCYNATWTLSPAQFEGEVEGTEFTMHIDSWQMWLEKDAMTFKKMEMEGTFTAEGVTLSFKMVETYTNSFTGSIWPLAVGNEETATQSGTSWFYVDLNDDGDFNDLNELDGPTPIPSETIRNVVEAEEDVTVAAGTFRCFKIVSYDDGNVITELWWSTEVKNQVKEIGPS